MRTELGRGQVLALVAVAAAVVLVAVAGATAMDDEPSGEAILNETRDRYARADSVVGTANVTVTDGTETADATVEFVTAGNGSRVVVTTANRSYRAGSNGSVAWYVAPNESAAYEHDALREEAALARDDTAATPRQVLNRTGDHYGNVSVTVLRTAVEDGTEAYVLRVTPENESHDGNATLWVARDDSRLLRATVTDGTNRTVVDFEDTRFNASVHDSTFDPPSDRVAVTGFEEYGGFAAAQSNTTLALPRLDATFERAGVVERPEGTAVAQEYAVGGDRVTVVSTTLDREFDDANGTAVEVNGRTATATTVRGGEAAVVYWRSGGVTTAVVVEADVDRALELARRLEG